MDNFGNGNGQQGESLNPGFQKDLNQEPDMGNQHVRFCAGADLRWFVLPLRKKRILLLLPCSRSEVIRDQGENVLPENFSSNSTTIADVHAGGLWARTSEIACKLYLYDYLIRPTWESQVLTSD